MRSLMGISEEDKQHLATMVLPERIRRSGADRFAWVMPAWRMDRQPVSECLVVILAEPRRRSALIADVARGPSTPLLGEWVEATASVEGLFVEPLCRALLAKRRPTQRKSRRRTEREPASKPRGQRVDLGRPLIAVCPDCRARLDEPHRLGCDVERCTVCFGQRLICRCEGHDALAAAWTGEWPGAAQCRALGWWAVRTEHGWRPCPPGTDGAHEDVNRLGFFFQTGYDCLYDELDATSGSSSLFNVATGSPPEASTELGTPFSDESWPANAQETGVDD
jgi:hypothetical protein